MMKINEYIEINPEIRFGRAVLKGTRIAVQDILELLANGMSREDILSEYPGLNDEQILACLRYVSNRERKTAIA